MSMIRVENLTFAYPSSYDNIFENVSFRSIPIGDLGLLEETAEEKPLS